MRRRHLLHGAERIGDRSSWPGRRAQPSPGQQPCARWARPPSPAQVGSRESSLRQRQAVGTDRWDPRAGGVVQSISCVQLSATPMDCSMPGFPVLHHLPEFAQTHVHRVSGAIQPSHPLLSPSPPAFNHSQHQGFFPVSRLFTSGGQSIGVWKHQSFQ